MERTWASTTVDDNRGRIGTCADSSARTRRAWSFAVGSRRANSSAAHSSITCANSVSRSRYSSGTVSPR